MSKIYVFILFCSLTNIFAAELMSPATQLKKKTFFLQGYYAKEKSKVDFRVDSNIFSCTGSGEKIVFKFTYAPWTNFYPWVKIGSVLKHYSLRFPSSAAATNSYLSNDEGFLWGVGGRWLLFPDTIVTPAICLDFGYTDSHLKVNDFDFKIFQYQGALLMSEQFGRFEPYWGFRVVPLISRFRNEEKEEMKGKTTNFALFFGFAGQIFSRGKLIGEMGWGSDKNFSGGLGVTFLNR